MQSLCSNPHHHPHPHPGLGLSVGSAAEKRGGVAWLVPSFFFFFPPLPSLSGSSDIRKGIRRMRGKGTNSLQSPMLLELCSPRRLPRVHSRWQAQDPGPAAQLGGPPGASRDCDPNPAQASASCAWLLQLPPSIPRKAACLVSGHGLAGAKYQKQTSLYSG